VPGRRFHIELSARLAHEIAEQPEAEVAAICLTGEVEADAVVLDLQRGDAVSPRNTDCYSPRVSMLHHVPQRFLSRTKEDRLDLGRQVAAVIDVQLRRQPAVGTRCEEVRQRRFETLTLELRRVDLDEEAPELADRSASLGSGFVECRVELRRRFGAGCRERVRNTGKVLDDPIVEVAGDTATLVLGSLDGTLQEIAALLLPFTHASCQPPRQRGSWIMARSRSPASMTNANSLKMRRLRAEM
jgi:hypothetical protein